jgi:CRP-like cAMP-binding protein
MSYIHSVDAIPLLHCIGKVLCVDDSVVETILGCCRDVFIPKGRIIFYEGDIAKYAYFIISGKARSYYTDNAGRTITWSFHFNEMESGFKHVFVADYKSFITQTPGTMTFEALTDITAIRIGQPELDPQCRPLPLLEKCLQKLNEYFFITEYERFFNFLTMSATDRYNKVLKNEPYLLQMFTDKYLASYIGIEPQSLSRIRKNLKSTPAPHHVRRLFE